MILRSSRPSWAGLSQQPDFEQLMEKFGDDVDSAKFGLSDEQCRNAQIAFWGKAKGHQKAHERRVCAKSEYRLKRTEAQTALEELGLVWPPEDEALSSASNWEPLHLHDFLSLVAQAHMWKIFTEIDIDGNGGLTAEELQQAGRRLGVPLSPGQCRGMVAGADRGCRDGLIDFGEFQSYFRGRAASDLRALLARWSAAAAAGALGGDGGGGRLLAGALPPPPAGGAPGLHAWQTVVAGGLGGVAARTATAPLEVALTRLQAGATGGMASVLRDAWSSGGIRGLFAGNLLNCLCVFPRGAITCTIYNKMAQRLDAKHSRHEYAERIFSAGTAAGIAVLLTYPIQLLQTRRIVLGCPARRGLATILNREGPRGLLRGLGPALAAVVPFVAVQNSTIDVAKEAAVGAGWAPTPGTLFVIGAASGLAAQTAVYPLEVLRTRAQLSGRSAAAAAAQEEAPLAGSGARPTAGGGCGRRPGGPLWRGGAAAAAGGF